MAGIGGDGSYLFGRDQDIRAQPGRSNAFLLVDISKVFTERQIDIKAMNTRINKQELATISTAFETKNREELHSLVEKLRQIDGVVDIERTTG